MGLMQYYRTLGGKDWGDPFTTIWKTDNVGDTGVNQIRIPVVAGGTYDFLVEWGDGTKNRIKSATDPNVTHTFPSPGTYEVKIYGFLSSLNFATTNEGRKLIEISQWGCYRQGASPTFYGCSELDVTATDVPDLSATNSIAGMFRGCVKLVGNSAFANWDTGHIQFFGTGNNGFIRDCKLFNAPISEWNTASGTAYNEFAFGANALDQNFGNYNMENTTLIANMLRDSNLSVENYSNTLIGWAGQNLKPNLTLRSRRLRYNATGQAARQYIIDNFNWTFLEDSLAI